jgi:PPOX class probable F420-dependent enzyme
MIDFSTPVGKKALTLFEREYFVWLTTVDAQLRPQPRPVWFIWEDGSFLIYSQAKAYKVRHVAQHPLVSLHFNADAEGEEDVVVILGEAVIDAEAPQAQGSPAYMQKYAAGIERLGTTPAQFSAEYSIAIRVRPMSVRD